MHERQWESKVNEVTHEKFASPRLSTRHSKSETQPQSARSDVNDITSAFRVEHISEGVQYAEQKNSEKNEGVFFQKKDETMR